MQSFELPLPPVNKKVLKKQQTKEEIVNDFTANILQNVYKKSIDSYHKVAKKLEKKGTNEHI